MKQLNVNHFYLYILILIGLKQKILFFQILDNIRDLILKFRSNNAGYMEKYSRYVIFNACLSWFKPDKDSKEISLNFQYLFEKKDKGKWSKYNITNDIFDVSTDIILVYDLHAKKVVYINNNSCLFRDIKLENLKNSFMIKSYRNDENDSERICNTLNGL